MNVPATPVSSHPPLEQLGIFRRAATTLASSLELEQTLANKIRVFLPALGDFGFFDAIVEGEGGAAGEVRRTAAAHDDPALEALLAGTRWQRQEPGPLNLCALSNGAPALHVGIDDAWYRGVAVNDEHLALLRTLNFSAMLSVPLRSGDTLIGALTLFMGRSGRTYTDGDLAFAAELAALAAPVVAHAALLARQRGAEAALRDSEQRLRVAVNAGGIGIWDWNLVTNKVAWSDQVHVLVGMAPGTFSGRAEDFRALVHPDDLPELVARSAECRATRGAFSIEMRATRLDGREIWLATWAQCTTDAAGVERLIGATVDITAQKRHNMSLTDVNSMLEQRVQMRTNERDRIWRMSRDVLAVLAPCGTLVSVNPAFTSLLGWPQEAAMGDKLLALVHPDERERMLQALCGAVAVHDVEIRMRHRDGDWRWLSWTFVPEEAQVYGVGRDVTALKRQHDEVLDASEKRLQLALSAGDMGAWQWNVRDDSCWWWPGVARLHGMPPDTPGGSMAAYLDLVMPEDQPRLRATVEAALREQRDYRAEYRIRTPRGEVRWIESHANLQLDGAGGIAHVGGVCIDITRRKRTEEDLRFLARASAQLAALDDIGTTLQRVARLAVPNFADWCALDLLEPDETLKRVAVAHVDPAKVRLAHELFERYPPQPGDGGAAWRIIARGRAECIAVVTDEMMVKAARDDGHLRVLRELGLRSFIGVPLAVRGRILGTLTFVSAETARTFGPDEVALAEDIGRRAAVAIDNANLYRTLQAADQRKDEFLAMLAHELRNPLAPIRVAADLLAMGPGKANLSAISGVLARQVGHMTALVDDLLDVSRVTRGSIELDRAPVSFKAVAASAVEQVRPLVDARNHRLQVNLADDAMTVMGDEKRLVQILANLLNNAAKYTPPGGIITLSAAPEGGQLQVEVRDNGIGMSADLVDRAFELFSQAARASDRAQGGLGLGLALVRRLVELHDGDVRAYSRGEGSGSRFVVCLPLLAPADSGIGGAPAAAIQPAGAGLRVLVVDDNQDAATVLGAYLATAGHEVDVCYDPYEALGRAQATAYDVCLLDIGLPGMDGHTLARRIRAGSPGGREAKAPVLVAVTGYGQSHDRSAALAAGFDHYLVKPVGAIDLHALLARVGV
jgi:PAS domain S-box-containing protein